MNMYMNICIVYVFLHVCVFLSVYKCIHIMNVQKNSLRLWRVRVWRVRVCVHVPVRVCMRVKCVCIECGWNKAALMT